MDSANETLTDRLWIRVSPTLKDRVNAAADADKRDRTEWARLVLEQHLDLRDRGFGPTIQALLTQTGTPR